MNDYAYTYPDDTSYLDGLSPSARRLAEDVLAESRTSGADLRDGLLQAYGTPVDKAAVAEVWGGPGAGAEFLR